MAIRKKHDFMNANQHFQVFRLTQPRNMKFPFYVMKSWFKYGFIFCRSKEAAKKSQTFASQKGCRLATLWCSENCICIFQWTMPITHLQYANMKIA